METRAYIEEGEAIGLNEGEVHRLLAAERRRLALEVLSDGEPRRIEDLTEEIVRREGDEELTTHAIKRATIDHYHSHLPLMDDLGAIEFDRRTKRIERCWIGVGVP